MELPVAYHRINSIVRQSSNCGLRLLLYNAGNGYVAAQPASYTRSCSPGFQRSDRGPCRTEPVALEKPEPFLDLYIARIQHVSAIAAVVYIDQVTMR